MNGYWVGVICGVGAASILFTCLMFSYVEQINKLRAEVKELREKVSEHDEIMQAYAFYNWQYTLKMDKEEK